jgi:hypothetical protein
MDRIRQKVVARVIAHDDWWENDADDPAKIASSMPRHVARHLIHQSRARCRQIVERFLGPSTRKS